MIAFVSAALSLAATQGRPIVIDVPVKLTEADVVFNIMSRGPIPARQNSLFLAKTMTGVLAADGTPRKIVAIFHSAAAALACSDAAFNRLTGTTAGNPYKARIAELQRDGVQTEICVKSMEFQKIAKSELLPGVKVNGGALIRVVELTQQGYTQLTF
ncbi:MAG TPA: DsrE family protein [Fimbriimonadaceae bacterium]|nr:DsrE family protein [Fimbriimonadaceae bacterium]